MKKLLSLVLSLCIIFSSFVVSFADEGDVEISFKVGDDTLLINGSPVTVETPYVTDSGTTLVPLRVITEAFGATVGWDGERQEITLEYPDVNITLTIGSSSAAVNSHTESLPEPPVLSPNGVTMVPLRFISETFGAQVGYDEETKGITVTKEAVSESSTISSVDDKPRIGDSFYGWSMNTPAGMLMSDRSFDGADTTFSDENSTFNLHIIKLDDDSTIDSSLNDVKSIFSSLATLTRAETGKDENGNPTYHVTARDKEDYFDYRGVFYNGYEYSIFYITPYDTTVISSLDAIADSFALSFGDESVTHDLSNVEDGTRLYTNEEFKLSFKLPADMSAIEDDTTVNGFAFASKDASVRLQIFSLSDTVTAMRLASDSRAYNNEYINPAIVTVTNVAQYPKPLGKNAMYFDVLSKTTEKSDMTVIYFEVGQYVYGLEVVYPKGTKDVLDTVVNSFAAEEIDNSVTGSFFYNFPDTSSTYKSSAGSWSLTLPSSWEEDSAPTSTGAAYVNSLLSSLIVLSVNDSSGIGLTEMRNFVNFIYERTKENFTQTVQAVSYNTYGGKGYYTFAFMDKDEDDGSTIYVTMAYFWYNNKIYCLTLYCPELYYKGKINSEFETILSSLTIS